MSDKLRDLLSVIAFTLLAAAALFLAGWVLGQHSQPTLTNYWPLLRKP